MLPRSVGLIHLLPTELKLGKVQKNAKVMSAAPPKGGYWRSRQRGTVRRRFIRPPRWQGIAPLSL